MKIAFETDILIPPISNAISILMDRANICIDDIHYDQVKGIVEIYMQRKELISFKKPFFREMQPVYGQTMIESLLTIRQVEAMDIEVDDRLITECNSCFTVLFGLKADGNRLYLGSVEETQGNMLCQIQ
jgi:hypothetical protein